MRKVFCLVLILVMVASLCIGCGKQDDTKQGDTKQGETSGNQVTNMDFPLETAVSMSLGIYQVPGSDVTKTLTLTEMEKRTNIQWDYQIFSEDIGDKLPLEFGSGEYKDVYIRTGLSDMNIAKYASQGVLFPLNDLINNHMPNLKKVLDEKGLWNYITSDDGNIYSLPQINDPGVGMLMFVNKTWMDKLNIKDPTNIEEFLDMLRAFRDQDPNGNGQKDEIPLSLCKDMLPFLQQYFGVCNDVLAGSMVSFDGDKAEYFPVTDAYKNYLRILRTMVTEGLVNSDYEVIGWQEQEAMTMTKDNVGAFIHWGGYLGVGSDRDEEFPGLVPLKESKIVVTSGFQSGGMVITDKCKYPELVAKWADYFYSKEGSELYWMGIDGDSYQTNADGTYNWKTDSIWGDNQTAILESATLMGYYQGPVAVPTIYNAGNQNADERFLWVQRNTAINSSTILPVLTWTDAEATERVGYIADIAPYVEQYRAAVATGGKNLDDSWDEYINVLNKMKLERLTEIDQNAYSRFLEKSK